MSTAVWEGVSVQIISTLKAILSACARRLRSQPDAPQGGLEPNHHARLDLLASFVPASYFTGYMREDISASFVIQEFPAAAFEALKDAYAGYESERLFADRGMYHLVFDQIERSDDHIFIQAEQFAGDMAFRKFILVFASVHLTAQITPPRSPRRRRHDL